MNLTENQITAVELLAKGETKTEAAKQAGVSRTTLYEWMEQAEFTTAIQTAKTECWRTAVTRLYPLSEKAADCLSDLITSDKTPSYVRCQAALGVLATARQCYHEGELEARIQQLEQALDAALTRIKAREDGSF